MTIRPLFWRGVLFVYLAIVSGCGGDAKQYRTAPVSGRVTLDGEPLTNAFVRFTPTRGDSLASQIGPEATATTDDSGNFKLVTAFNDPGASVGKNQVMINTRQTKVDPNDADKVLETAKERVPKRYFDREILSFDVPESGSDAANFDLKSK